MSFSAVTVFPPISAWSFCCKAGVPADICPCCHCLLQSLRGGFALTWSPFCRWIPCKYPSLLSLSGCCKLESLLSLESLQLSFSAVTVFPAISAGSFCCNLESPLSLESLQVSFSDVTVFPAISAGSFCYIPGVPVVAGVPAGVFLCCHCLTCNLCMAFLL